MLSHCQLNDFIVPAGVVLNLEDGSRVPFFMKLSLIAWLENLSFSSDVVSCFAYIVLILVPNSAFFNVTFLIFLPTRL